MYKLWHASCLFKIKRLWITSYEFEQIKRTSRKLKGRVEKCELQKLKSGTNIPCTTNYLI